MGLNELRIYWDRCRKFHPIIIFCSFVRRFFHSISFHDVIVSVTTTSSSTSTKFLLVIRSDNIFMITRRWRIWCGGGRRRRLHCVYKTLSDSLSAFACPFGAKKWNLRNAKRQKEKWICDRFAFILFFGECAIFSSADSFGFSAPPLLSASRGRLLFAMLVYIV